MKYLKKFESFKTFSKIDPKGVYPNDLKSSFGSSEIVILKDKEEWNLFEGDHASMINKSNYGGASYGITDGDDEQYEITDPSTFVEGIDFDWA